MYFQEVELRNFRNLREIRVPLEERCVLIVGDNAQGKSNFLEALFLLARGFSPRRARDNELVSFGEEGALLRARVREGETSFMKEVLIRRNGGKEWRVNGKRFSRGAPIWLTGHFPEDAAVVGGAPRERRDFFDQAISFLYLPYHQFLRSYEKVVERRNWLLREGDPSGLLPVYTEKMIALGSRIVEWRVKYTRSFAPFLEQTYQEIFGGGKLTLRYRSEGYLWEEGIGEGLRKAWKLLQKEEEARGMTLFGPHRDEVLFLLEGQEVRDFASSGEKKGVALALRLAEMAVMEHGKKTRAVVLFDDLFSEFDEKRQHLVLRKVCGKNQVFVTTAGREGVRENVKDLETWGFVMEGGQMKRWW